MTPIALFAYNRPAHVDAALDALSRCRRLDECQLHIFCDGPRSGDDESAVAQTRAVVRTWAERLDATVIKRDTNYGLSRSIITGITGILNNEERIIVLEDDHRPGPDFVDYMLQALDRFVDCPRVHQISGYMFPVDHPNDADAFFLPLITTWGWATWRRVWSVVDWHAGDAADQLADPAVRSAFDLDDSYPYAKLLHDRLAGRNDSWGILFWWSVFNAGGVALHPRVSLNWLGGFDGSGTHCGRRGGDDDARWHQIRMFRFNNPIRFPDVLNIDTDAYRRVREHHRAQRRPRTTNTSNYNGRNAQTESKMVNA